MRRRLTSRLQRKPLGGLTRLTRMKSLAAAACHVATLRPDTTPDLLRIDTPSETLRPDTLATTREGGI